MADADRPVRGGSDLARRTVVGFVLAAAALALLWAGGMAWWAAITPVALLALIEWGGLVGADRLRLGIAIVMLGATLAGAAPGLWGTDRATVALLLIGALLFALVPRATAMAAGLAYLGLAAIALLYLRGLPSGLALAAWTLLIVWATDIGAYFSGRAFRGPRLAPRISPGKTWAGLIGGMAVAAIVGAVLGDATHLPEATLWLGAPLAVLAQCGDLLESAMKRRIGVKDSGRLLPGHGGVLDRIDGALPVAILVAAFNANGVF